MRRVFVLLTLMISLGALAAEPDAAPVAAAAASRFTAALPDSAVVRIESLGEGEAADDFFWRLGDAFTQAGVRLSDPEQLGENHRQLVRLQEDPVYEGQARPGRFVPPTHRVWGKVRQTTTQHLGKPYITTEVRLGLEDLAAGVSLSRFDMEQTVRRNPPVWTLLALFGLSLLVVVVVNAGTRGHGGPAALFVALAADLLYLAWFVLV